MTKLTIGLVCAAGLLFYSAALWVIYSHAPAPTVEMIRVAAR